MSTTTGRNFARMRCKMRINVDTFRVSGAGSHKANVSGDISYSLRLRFLSTLVCCVAQHLFVVSSFELCMQWPCMLKTVDGMSFRCRLARLPTKVINDHFQSPDSILDRAHFYLSRGCSFPL